MFSGSQTKNMKVERAMSLKRIKDIKGMRYSRLTVVELVGSFPVDKSGRKQAHWKCLCDCGLEKIVPSHSLKFNLVKSCGCLNVESRLKMVKSLETRKKRSEKMSGSNNHNYKANKYSDSDLVRRSFEYKAWRKDVFERDNFTCQICLKRGVRIQADHIKSFSMHPELRLDLSNGRTLCVECHRKTDNYGLKEFYKLKREEISFTL